MYNSATWASAGGTCLTWEAGTADRTSDDGACERRARAPNETVQVAAAAGAHPTPLDLT